MAIIPKIIDDQVEELRSKKLDLGSQKNEVEIKNILIHNNYYRLRGYFTDFFYQDNLFVDGTRFVDIYNAYNFDSILRNLIEPVLETVEISFKTIIAYHMSINYGAFFHYDKTYFCRESGIEDVNHNMAKYIKNHKHSKVIKRYTDIETGKVELPIWAYIEFLSFGDVSKLFDALDFKYKKEINNKFFLFNKNVGPEFLSSWYRSLSKFRNICSHHERLYSMKFLETPPKITSDAELDKHYRVDQNNQSSVFYYFLVICMLCPNKMIVKKMIEKLVDYQKSFSSISLQKKYGFPENWVFVLENFSGYFINTLITSNLDE